MIRFVHLSFIDFRSFPVSLNTSLEPRQECKKKQWLLFLRTGSCLLLFKANTVFTALLLTVSLCQSSVNLLNGRDIEF